MNYKSNISKTRIYRSDLDVVDAEKIAQHKSLGHYLLNKLKNEHSEATVFTDFRSGRTWKGLELHNKILNVAAALVDKYNIEVGTAVCICYDSTDKSVILALGLICVGALVAWSFYKDPYNHVLYLAQKVRPKFLFTFKNKCADWGERLARDLGDADLRAIPMDGEPIGFYSLKNLLEYDHEKSKAKVPCELKDIAKQVALVTMSSGTTGKPKVVPVTHLSCINGFINGDFMSQINIRCVNTASCTSLDYVSGRIIMFGAINYGYNVVIMNGFDRKMLADAIEKHKINFLFLGAASFYELITWSSLDSYDLSSLELIFPLGAKVSYLSELEKFLSKNPSIKTIQQAYGSSECGGVVTSNILPPSEYLKDCDNCGKLLPGVLAKLVYTEDASQFLNEPKHQVGVLHIGGEFIFPGYYDKQMSVAETKTYPFKSDESVFDQEGFYITGDLVYFDESENMHFVGRQTETLVCRGFLKALPIQLEEVLAEHPAVLKVCVLGILSKSSALLQHFPRAFIVPHKRYYESLELIDQLCCVSPTTDDAMELKYSGNEKTTMCSLPIEYRRRLTESLMKFANENLAWFKQLTGGIVLLDDIPCARSGKIDKNYLRALTCDQVEIYGDQSHDEDNIKNQS